MITRDALMEYLQRYLACDDFKDYAPNGLQVEGKLKIKCLCSGVTASADVIEQAIALDADALLVHHGYFWKGEPPDLLGMKRDRIARLLASNINLYAHHLPLDCHLELGNNVCLGRLFGLQNLQSHAVSNTPNLLWSGTFVQAYTLGGLSQFIQAKLGREPLCIPGSSKKIKTIAWCSGAAQDFIEQAHSLGVDAYLSGEVSERTYYQAKELGIHYLSCGHHATERFGVQEIGEHLSKNFELKYHFIDSDNPI